MGWLAVASAALVTAATTTNLAQDVDSGTAPQPPGQIDVFKTAPEEFNRVTVPVTVEGQGPYRFMIDTGAQATVLSLDLADKIGVADRKTATLVGISSRAQTTVAPVMVTSFCSGGVS